MKLLIVLALAALASASQEPKPVELLAPVMPTVTEQKTDATAESVPTADTTPEVVKLVHPTLTASSVPSSVKVVELTPNTLLANEIVPTPISDEVVPVKVVEAPVEAVKVIPIDVTPPLQNPAPTPVQVAEGTPLHSPEAIQELFPNPMSLIDIGTLIVPEEVMRQVALMNEQETDAVNIGGPHPFSFDNAEPLDSIERVTVVESPVNQLDAKMDPVVVVESPIGEQARFDTPTVPEAVKVVDINPADVVQAIPIANWRGPPQLPEKNWRGPPQTPEESWGVPPPMPQEYMRELLAMHRPRPPFYRDIPRGQYVPLYHDAMLR